MKTTSKMSTESMNLTLDAFVLNRVASCAQSKNNLLYLLQNTQAEVPEQFADEFQSDLQSEDLSASVLERRMGVLFQLLISDYTLALEPMTANEQSDKDQVLYSVKDAIRESYMNKNLIGSSLQKVSVELDSELKSQLVAQAAEMHLPLSELVNTLLVDSLCTVDARYAMAN